jgi:hypothetical protein
MCAVMLYCVVEDNGTIVMCDKENIDYWGMILKGVVMVKFSDGSTQHHYAGDR